MSDGGGLHKGRGGGGEGRNSGGESREGEDSELHGGGCCQSRRLGSVIQHQD